MYYSQHGEERRTITLITTILYLIKPSLDKCVFINKNDTDI